MFDVEYGSKNCASNFIENTDILIIHGITSAENKGLECTITHNNIKSRFPSYFFF